jgi:type IV pilus assembly protein PilW
MKRALKQAGLTLVELMVAMVLMLVVTLAAISMFSAFTGSYKTADNTQGMQDDARFVMEVVGQALRNAGFQGRIGPVTTVDLTDIIFGPTQVNASAWRIQGAHASRLTTGSSLSFSTSSVVNSSDALITRFFGANLPDPANPAAPQWSSGNPVADGTMVDCAGRAIPYPTSAGDLGVSAFFVDTVDGEPELECASYNPATSQFSVSQIARGVEIFQVAYGIDTNADGVPNQWLSANTAWDVAANSPNWNTVVAVRIGMVMRGDVGSAQVASTATLYPLGQDFTGSTSTTGWSFTPPADGRIRKVFTTTFMLRNHTQ